MIEQIGGFGDEPAFVVLHGSHRGFDGLLAQLFGAMGHALVQQGARIGVRSARLGALVHAFFQIGESELAHAAFLITSPRLRGEGGHASIRIGRPAFAMYCLACRTVCSPKWKIEAASTAVAWPSRMPATR